MDSIYVVNVYMFKSWGLAPSPWIGVWRRKRPQTGVGSQLSLKVNWPSDNLPVYESAPANSPDIDLLLVCASKGQAFWPARSS